MSHPFEKLGSSSTTTHLNNITSYPSSNVSKPDDANDAQSIYSTSDGLIASLTSNMHLDSKSKSLSKDNITKFSLLNRNFGTHSQSDSNKNNANNIRNTGIGRDYWLDDASATKCRSCDRKFTTFLRKHHCRICGKIFCSNCTTFIDGTKFNYNGSMRVCLLCNKLADRYDEEVFSSEDEEDEVEHTVLGENAKIQGSHLKKYEDPVKYTVLNNEPQVICQDKEDVVNYVGLSPPLSLTSNNQRLLRESKHSEQLEDDNEMISFMNNHQFNWPNTTDSRSSSNSTYNNPYTTNDTPHFLSKMNTFRSTSNTAMNSVISQQKSNRRRVFSHRYKNRKGIKNIINTPKKSNTISDVNVEFYDDFQKIGEQYAKCLLNELLIDKKIYNYREWSDVLTKALKKINNIEIDVKSLVDSETGYTDANYNFSNYIKIKKIVSTSRKRVKTIEGLMFSKKLPLKTMPTTIKNPKIMLITFPIEYDQDINNKHHFQSLESIIAQQNEYIRKLAERIINLKPMIILSSNSINGLALKLFAKANISVAPNCKLSNLIKLSKFTGATIITSIDILAMKPVLGTCGIFEALSFKFENIVRSYLVFDECPNKVGLTLILRDASDEVLTKVKACLMIMMFAFTNIRLESGFLRDHCLKVVDDRDTVDFIHPEEIVPLYAVELNGYEDFTTLLHKRLISISPWVKFDEPAIVKQLEKIKQDLKMNDDNFIEYSQSKGEKRNTLLKAFDISLPPIKHTDQSKLVFAMKTYKENVWRVDLSILLKKWDQFWKSRELTFFDPNYNQNIFVLFSMISTKNSTPCIGPEIQLIDFYWENDYSLGQFIENMCTNADGICNRNCQLSLKDHYRSYVHDDGKIDIFVEDNTFNVLSNTIMNWSECKKCQSVTPVLPLSDLSYKYSFGKFLELLFWFNKSFEFKILNNKNTCQCLLNNSEFDFFKEYTHYFSFKKYKLKMQYNKIQNLSLVMPKFKIFWNPKYGYSTKCEHYNDIKLKSASFFDSVLNRLARIKLDGTNLEATDMQAGTKMLEELKEKLDIQKKEIDLLLETVYKDTNIDEHLKLNVIIREVQELSSFWNFEFQSFAKSYLPSEKDVKKITAFQLDRLFRSLAGKEDYESDDEQKNSENLENDDKVKSADLLATDSKIPTSPRKHKSQLILNKIHQLNSKQNDDIFWMQPDKESDSILDEGKVKQLTKFFDTQEYFNQRELEKRKLENSSKYTPKVSNMKPKIEIYKSASDAVNSDATKLAKEDSKVPYCVEDQKLTEKQNNDEEFEKEVQPEKVSILKSLTNFWADRSATLWEPLYYPLNSSEHIFVDSDVIVREDEPSSIISFCLSTSDYETKLASSNANPAKETDAGSIKLESNTEKDPHLEEKRADESDYSEDQQLESIMLRKGFHLKYQFEEGYSTILCKIFFTQQFDALRKKCGVSSKYIESLARCVKWDSTGGKSGSTFLKTLDQRFIIKELSKAELEAFVHFAPSYFEYFAHVLFHDLPSVLVKIFGFYQIQVKNTLPNSKSYTMDILIMENLFYDRKIDRIFDLKGSMRNRHVEQTGKENEVLLDENMVEYIYESPLYVKENDKRLLRVSLWNDTLFLEKMNVMDYSLVVGLDHSNNELVVGIIDCIRTFTWDKKLESWVKEKGLVGNTGVGKEPTVITPKQYKTRFREAMERYILMSPGVYYQGTPNSS
ncbi:hypothetical protein CANINC_001814 [Pichia inconspicua]|uniref:1-phosphatidylinositol-3-phosphate 5-kinase n=1 Tax=Pichia inconspicua TaxID=52247 RepID=A0A4V4NFV4_9ASCO|nr:hypothetical protein CANINC_001814 [[Candida] inconspicua]